MITHNEARNVLVLGKMVWNESEFAESYISQQEKKDKLLKLYMANYKPTFEDVVDLEIEQLKKELGEMK